MLIHQSQHSPLLYIIYFNRILVHFNCSLASLSELHKTQLKGKQNINIIEEEEEDNE